MKIQKVLVLLSILAVLGCSQTNQPQEETTTENTPNAEIQTFEGEYTLFDPAASRGNLFCIVVTENSAGQLPAEFLTPDDGVFPNICLDEASKEKAGVTEVFNNLSEGCKYSEVGNQYTITNLQIIPGEEYEKRAELVSITKFLNGTTVCE